MESVAWICDVVPGKRLGNVDWDVFLLMLALGGQRDDQLDRQTDRQTVEAPFPHPLQGQVSLGQLTRAP